MIEHEPSEGGRGLGSAMALLWVVTARNAVKSILMVIHDGLHVLMAGVDPRFLQCRDGARRSFTDQAGIACTKREAP